MAEIEVKDLIIEAIKSKKLSLLKELFETVPNIDIAEAMEEIEDVAQLIYVFRVISSEYTAYVFSELSPETQEKIINAFTHPGLLRGQGFLLLLLLQNQYVTFSNRNFILKKECPTLPQTFCLDLEGKYIRGTQVFRGNIFI
jgi:hypothetical protein